MRRACLYVSGNGEPPRRELVDDGGGRLAHECRWHARRSARRDALVNESESFSLEEGTPLPSFDENVLALAVLAVGAVLYRLISAVQCLWLSTTFLKTHHLHQTQ